MMLKIRRLPLRRPILLLVPMGLLLLLLLMATRTARESAVFVVQGFSTSTRTSCSNSVRTRPSTTRHVADGYCHSCSTRKTTRTSTRTLSFWTKSPARSAPPQPYANLVVLSASSQDDRDSSTVQQQEAPSPPDGLNWGLIAQNVANQALIGSTLWTGGPQYQTLMNDAAFGPFSVALGVLGVAPLLFLSRRIETSESYLVSGLNLSTNMAVLRLFGAKPRPVLALVVSAFIATLTGVVEEVTFRGTALPAFSNNFGGGNEMVGAVLSTLLFAVLHTNPASLLKPQDQDAFMDNLTLLVLQLINGSAFCLLYLWSGHNLAVPIITHALYDFYTFYKTHLVDVAGQMEYAKREALMPVCQSKRVEQQWIQQRGADFVTQAKQTFYLMDTNQDGVLSRKELRVALFSYGVNLSVRQSQTVARAFDVDRSGGIDFQEFLQFVGPAGSTTKAVRNTLFGPT